MSALKRIIRNEPVLIAGLIEAVIVLSISFGLGVSVEQSAAILVVTTLVLSLAARAMSAPANPL